MAVLVFIKIDNAKKKPTAITSDCWEKKSCLGMHNWLALVKPVTIEWLVTILFGLTYRSIPNFVKVTSATEFI